MEKLSSDIVDAKIDSLLTLVSDCFSMPQLFYEHLLSFNNKKVTLTYLLNHFIIIFLFSHIYSQHAWKCITAHIYLNIWSHFGQL